MRRTRTDVRLSRMMMHPKEDDGMNYYYLGRLVLAVSAVAIFALLIGLVDLFKKISTWGHRPGITGKHALSGVK